jgi:hypothetical protein
MTFVEPVSTGFPKLALALGSRARAEAGAKSPLKRAADKHMLWTSRKRLAYQPFGQAR